MRPQQMRAPWALHEPQMWLRPWMRSCSCSPCCAHCTTTRCTGWSRSAKRPCALTALASCPEGTPLIWSRCGCMRSGALCALPGCNRSTAATAACAQVNTVCGWPACHASAIQEQTALRNPSKVKQGVGTAPVKRGQFCRKLQGLQSKPVQKRCEL